VRDGSWFFPLCTAIEISQSKKNPAWFTFTPYEVGSDQLGLYIPIWALGRKFARGVSAAENNPLNCVLVYLMGIWGSALSGTFKQLYDKSAKNLLVRQGLGGLLKQF
jgi:phospholipase A2